MSIIPKDEPAELLTLGGKAPLAVNRLKTQTLHPSMGLVKRLHAMSLNPPVRRCLHVTSEGSHQSNISSFWHAPEDRPCNSKPIAAIYEAAGRNGIIIHCRDIG